MPLPIIKAIATEKIHGTNAGLSYSAVDGLWVQSKNNIIGNLDGHFGCPFFIHSKIDEWWDIIILLANEYNIDLDEKIITIYFEWCGENIQKNSAVSGLSKRAVLFQHFKVSPIGPNRDIESIWLETKANNNWVSNPDNNIFNIMDFKTWEIEIDFNKPFEAQNKMIEIVNEIEPNSPFGQSFGKENIGEGIVVTFKHQGNIYKFKVKGEKHSVTKVKTLKLIDEEAENKIIDFANYACVAWRLEQCWHELFETESPTPKKTGEFLRLVVNDVMKEEVDIISEKGLDIKKVNKAISKVARQWFFEQLDQIIIGNEEN